jgi:glycosyltransferase involved in cell wall biosynthesis
VRVVYVNQDPGIGPERKKGAAVHVSAMQQAFRALGCEVVALEEKDEQRAAAALAALHAERTIDLLYERYALGAAAAGRFARRSGVPHVLEVNAPLLEEAARHRGAALDTEAQAREAAVLALPDRIFAVSSAVAQHALALGVPPERVRVHPNAVDAERFRPRDRATLRREMGLPAEAFVLGFHGRLRPWHGFERIASAARELTDRGRFVHVLAIGEGAFSAALAAAGMAERSTCLQWVPHEEMPRLVACFDALPLGYGSQAPFYFSPLKLLEAMACGAVPVVPDLGELPALVEHGAAGSIYGAGSTQELAAALEGLIENPGRCAELGARAVSAARQRSWKAIARDALELAHGETVA